MISGWSVESRGDQANLIDSSYCGHNPKKGVLGNVHSKKVGSYELVLHKERVLGTEVAQKWVLGSLFITYLYVYLYI